MEGEYLLSFYGILLLENDWNNTKVNGNGFMERMEGHWGWKYE